MPPGQTYEIDWDLVAAVIRGDEGAADRFVDRFTPFIFAVLVRDVGVYPERAEDLYQEVFQRLWEAGHRRLRMWRGEGSFVSYLGPIVRHLAYDRFGHENLRREVPIGTEGDDRGSGHEVADARPLPEDLVLLGEERARIQIALGKLRRRDRLLVEKRHYEEKSYREIGADLGMKVNHVGVALSRAERRLARELKKLRPAWPKARKKAVIREGEAPSRW